MNQFMMISSDFTIFVQQMLDDLLDEHPSSALEAAEANRDRGSKRGLRQSTAGMASSPSWHASRPPLWLAL
jgi:hypothetical protein